MKSKISKASKIALFTSLALLASEKNFGQCTTPTFQDNFNTSNLWTISDPSGCSSAPDVNGRILNTGGSNGNLSFTGIEAAGCNWSTTTGARNGSELRAYRPIATLNNSSWTAEFKFRITKGNGLCHTLLAVTAGNQNPEGRWVTTTDDGVTTTNFVGSNQDGIFASIIAYGGNQYPGSTSSRPFIPSVQSYDQSHMGLTIDPADMGWRIYGHAKNGSDPFYVNDQDVDPVAASNINNPTANYSRGISLKALDTDYYLRLERTSPNTCQISVFEDAAMTIPLVGSPQCFTIDPNIVNLNTVQNTTHASGARTRTAEGYIDDLKIFDNCNPHKLIPIITCNTTFCQGAPINVTGTNTGNTTAAAHYWEIVECLSDGSTVSNGYVYSAWPTGSLGNFQFSNSLACNKYYRIKLALKNMTECLPWAETTKVIYVACNPTPTITGNNNICLGSSTTLCVNDDYFQPSNTYTLTWGPKKNNVNCITVTPTLSGQFNYNVTVTNTITGCIGQGSYVVNVNKNDPTFSYSVNTSAPSYNVISARGNDLTAASVSGFGEQWFIDEINPTTGANIQSTYPQNPNCWWVFPTTNYFTGFNNLSGSMTVDCITGPQLGRFNKTKTYRITRGTWNSSCPWAQSSSTISPQMLRTSNNTITGTSVMDNTTDYSNARSLFNTAKNNNSTLNGKLTLFPNPSNGLLNINFENALNTTYNIEVFDVFGKLIYKNEILNITGYKFNAEINLTNLNLSNGLYLINVNSDNQKTSQRVVIEK